MCTAAYRALEASGGNRAGNVKAVASEAATSIVCGTLVWYPWGGGDDEVNLITQTCNRGKIRYISGVKK